MNLRDNNIIVGIITGLLVPVLAYGLWTLLFNLLTSVGVMDPSGFSASWRLRTVALLSICMNIIPFNLHKKWRHSESMRGLIFPTILFVIVWVIYFKNDLFVEG